MAQNQSITEEITGLREENRRLRERLEDFQHLQRVLETVISTLQVDEVLRNIVEETSRICQADEGAIILFDPSGEGEAKTLIRQEVGTRTRLNHHLNSLLAGWVMHHRQPLLTADLAKTFGDHLPSRRYEGVGSALGVPLMIRGELIGCLNLIRYIGKSPLGERERQLILLLTPTFAQFIRHARLHDELFAETHRLRHEVQEKYAVHGIIGRSAAMQEVFALLERVIPTQARVLIQGESGTGKELIARVIHYSGPRKKGPFVAVDCGAIPANLLEA
ncbi:MAG: GAF domain-containing protein, partial [Calditrichaeota bacterium]